MLLRVPYLYVMVVLIVIVFADPGGHCSTNPDASDAAGQHGLDHTAVALDVPALECECTNHGTRQYSDADMEASSCREGGELYFFVSARGLVPWFVYELEIKWSLDIHQITHTWKSFVKTETDSYTFREPLLPRYDDFRFGMMAWDAYKKDERFLIEVTVRDMYPGLTTEESLIGSRNIDSSVNTVPCKCVEHPVKHRPIRFLWPAEGAYVRPGGNVDVRASLASAHVVSLNISLEVNGVLVQTNLVGERDDYSKTVTHTIENTFGEGRYTFEIAALWPTGVRDTARTSWYVNKSFGSNQWGNGLSRGAPGTTTKGVSVGDVMLGTYCCLDRLGAGSDMDADFCCTSSVGWMYAHSARSRGDVPYNGIFSEDTLMNFHERFQTSGSHLVNRIVRHVTMLNVPGCFPYPIPEIAIMAAAMVHARPDLVFEWGTNVGCSARVFFEAAKDLGLDTVIYSVDLPLEMSCLHVQNPLPGCAVWHPGSSVGAVVRGEVFAGRVFLHEGDGLDVSKKIWNEKGWPAARILWFLDGDHRHENVLRELNEILDHESCRRGRGGGWEWSWPGDGCYILLHDTHGLNGLSPGPHSALSQVFKSVSDRFGKVESHIGPPGMTLLFPLGT
jgi:hypothetical protein